MGWLDEKNRGQESVVEKDERPGKRRLRHRTSNEKQTSTLGTFPVYPSEVLVEKEK